MLKKRQNILRRFVCMALTGAIVLQIPALEVYAATKTWYLFYAPNLAPTEVITSWSSEVVTTSNTTTVQVRQVGGGAKINVSTSNGMGSIFSAKGSSTISTIKGKAIRMAAFYSDRGTSTSRPDGYFVY